MNRHKEIDMRNRILVAVTTMALMGGWGLPAKAEPPATASAMAVINGEDIGQSVIPEVRFDDGVSLTDAVDFFRETVPGLQIIVVRAPGVPSDYPKLPPIRAKNVSVEQLMVLLQRAVPGVEFEQPIPGPKSVIFTLRVAPPPNDLFGKPKAEPEQVRVVPPGPVVTVFRLVAIVDPIADARMRKSRAEKGDLTPAAADKAALADILSVLTNALRLLDSEPPMLRIHDETETLIFKGTVEQQRIVEATLAALAPPGPSQNGQQIDALRDALQDRIDEASKRLAMSTAQQQTLEEQLRELSIVNERLKIRLEESRAATPTTGHAN